MTEDSVEVQGLGVLLDEENLRAPYLDLTLRSGDSVYRAAILAAGDEWALTVTDASGQHVVRGEFFRMQAEAILAAQLAVLALRFEFGR